MKIVKLPAQEPSCEPETLEDYLNNLRFEVQEVCVVLRQAEASLSLLDGCPDDWRKAAIEVGIERTLRLCHQHLDRQHDIADPENIRKNRAKLRVKIAAKGGNHG